MLDIHRIAGAAYAVTVNDGDFFFADANAPALAMTGMAVSFHPGLTPDDVFPRAVAEEILQRYRTCVATRQAMSHVSEAHAPTGARSWQTTLFPIDDGEGRVVTIIGILSTPPEGATSTLSLNAKASMAIDLIEGGYWIYEVADQTFETSRSLAELLAGPGHATLSLAEYLSHVHSEDFRFTQVKDTTRGSPTTEYRVFTHDGRQLWLRSRRRVLRDKTRAPVRVVSVVTEITREKIALDTAQTEASTDALTSIKNRRAFDRIAADAFRASRADETPLGILLIDLDGFKPINDRHGHRIGDEILRKVARRIARYVRKSDCFARLGGDEFAVLIRGASAESGEALAARLRQSFAKPFMVGEDAVFLGISTGVGLASDDDTRIADVMDRADRALYAMKQARRLKTA